MNKKAAAAKKSGELTDIISAIRKNAFLISIFILIIILLVIAENYLDIIESFPVVPGYGITSP